MKKQTKSRLRPALFTVGGALAGLGYYALVGCSGVACGVAASPVHSMIYMGFVGWLFSGLFQPCCCGSCSR